MTDLLWQIPLGVLVMLGCALLIFVGSGYDDE